MPPPEQNAEQKKITATRKGLFHVVSDLPEDVTAGSLPQRKLARPAHLCPPAFCRMRGCLLTAGPEPAIDAEDPADAGFTGSTVIADFTVRPTPRLWPM